jgi:LytS/YehU family sensor histidine kinase
LAPGKKRAKGGNKMAMTNIRQRFDLAYGNRATVVVDESDTNFTVSLSFPFDEHSA